MLDVFHGQQQFIGMALLDPAELPDNADLRRKARTAVTAKMARVAYALIKSDRPYRCRFEQGLPSGSIPLSTAVEAIRTS